VRDFRTRLLTACDATLGALICEMARLTGLGGVRAMPPAPLLLSAGAAPRVLFIRLGGIGDMLVALPMLATFADRYPEAVITIACERRNSSVLDLAPFAHQRLVVNRQPIRFLRQLRGKAYDIVIDTEQFHYFSGVFAWLSGAAARVGFNINPRRNALYTHLVPYAVCGHEADQFMALLASLGITPEGEAPPALQVDRLSTLEQIRPELKSLTAPFAVLHPGASTRYKQWGFAHFARVARALHEQHGFSVVLTGDAGDAEICNAVLCAEPTTPMLSLAGRLPLVDVARLFAQASIFVGTDSGLAHLAAALDTPSVVLFGSTDPGKWGARGKRHRVVRHRLSCSPCAIFGYFKPCDSIACMQAIGEEEVIAAAAELLVPTIRIES
jgi:lipopolysaccharide heptosyltransferase II